MGIMVGNKIEETSLTDNENLMKRSSFICEENHDFIETKLLQLRKN